MGLTKKLYTYLYDAYTEVEEVCDMFDQSLELETERLWLKEIPLLPRRIPLLPMHTLRTSGSKPRSPGYPPIAIYNINYLNITAPLRRNHNYMICSRVLCVYIYNFYV